MSGGMICLAVVVVATVLISGATMACAETEAVFLISTIMVIAGLAAVGLIAVWYSSGVGHVWMFPGGLKFEVL